MAETAAGSEQGGQRATWRRRAADQPGSLLFESTAEPGAESRSLLFSRPLRTLTARTDAELEPMLREVEQALREGHYVAGYLTYEAGCVLGGVRHRATAGALAWFGVYDAPEVAEALPPAVSSRRRLPLCVSRELAPGDYAGKFAAVQERLLAGESYQVNLTTAARFSFQAGVAELYTALAAEQPAPFSALLHPAAGEHILSFSPELFFRLEPDRRIVTRPMKGTAPLDGSEENAGQQAAWLHGDSKNRAEHVMIVDLLRNDLGRVCETGSVAVESLFAVERYRTLLQMTSTISGRLREELTPLDALRALFPSGSMTGAPKRRTMEILAELEEQARGVYSGALGFLAPDGTGTFSVAIRTVELREGQARMGVGGGVVADSVCDAEYAECWLKARFLLAAAEPFALVETMRWDGGYAWLDDHLHRLASSAEALGFAFDRSAMERSLEVLGLFLAAATRVRVLLDRDGKFRFESSALETWRGPLRARLSTAEVWSGDHFLRQKTTHRPVYDSEQRAAQAAGFDEVLFVNERGEVTEGSITSVLIRLDGEWVTPPLQAGVLPGTARGLLLRSGAIRERIILRDDLRRAEAIGLANGVRGTGVLRELELASGEVLQFPVDLAVPQI